MAFVCHKLVIKSATRFKSILCQHALAETMNGVDRSLIHLTLCLEKNICRLFVIVELTKQRLDDWIGAVSASKSDTRIMDSRPNTIAQLRCCRFGKGHHQNLIDGKRDAMLGLRTTMAKQKAQV